MADIVLMINAPSVVGTNPNAQVGVDDGDEYLMANDGRTMLLVSGGAAAAAMTIHTGGLTASGLAIADVPVAIPIGEHRQCGPFRADEFDDAQNRVKFTFAADDATLRLETLQAPA